MNHNSEKNKELPYTICMENGDYTKLFAIVSNNLDIFIHELKRKKSNLLATDEWTVKDVLCHIVFWHENYAANYKALATKQKPPLLEGPGYKLNKDSVHSLRKHSTQKLIQRLLKAQNTLYRSIVEKKVPQMTYKKNGRVFKTADFLDAIARHIVTHTKQVKRAK